MQPPVLSEFRRVQRDRSVQARCSCPGEGHDGFVRARGMSGVGGGLPLGFCPVLKQSVSFEPRRSSAMRGSGPSGGMQKEDAGSFPEPSG
jgi:hypothetical protein